MLCPKCNNENRDGAKFCDQCGTLLTSATETGEQIGAQNDTDSMLQFEASADAREELFASPPSNQESTFRPAHAKDELGEDGELEPDLKPDEASSEAESESVCESADEAPYADEDDAGKDESDQGHVENALIDGDATPVNEEDATAVLLDAPESPDMQPKDDVTQSIGVDLAGFDRQAEDYGEQILSTEYQPPADAFRDGDTMQMPRLESEEASKSKDYRASSTTKQQKGKVGKIALIVVVIVAAIAGIAALASYQMELWGGKVIPNVVGMTEADALVVLSERGFEPRSEQVKSDDTEGLVLIMDPAAGQRVEEGSEVVVHIATSRTIPEIVGTSKEKAKEMLAEAGYENVKFIEKVSDKEKGTVIAVKPGEGKNAKSTTQVIVATAIPYTVPDVTGMYADTAIETIQEAGFICDVAYYDTPDYPEGTVVNTDPAVGTEVQEGAYIVINVAQARGQKLEGIVQGYLAPGAQVDVGGVSYTISSLDSVSYQGGNVVAYSATAQPYMTFFGRTVEGEPQQINGTVLFNENDQIVSVQ